jgi:hypothetical protein
MIVDKNKIVIPMSEFLDSMFLVLEKLGVHAERNGSMIYLSSERVKLTDWKQLGATCVDCYHCKLPLSAFIEIVTRKAKDRFLVMYNEREVTLVARGVQAVQK